MNIDGSVELEPRKPNGNGTEQSDAVGITIEPQLDLVLVRLMPQDKTEGGIHIPKASRRRTRLGAWKVLAVGPGRWVQGGFQKPAVQPGDKVMLEPSWVAQFDSNTNCYVSGEYIERGTPMGLVSCEHIAAIVRGEDERILIGDIVNAADMVE